MDPFNEMDPFTAKIDNFILGKAQKLVDWVAYHGHRPYIRAKQACYLYAAVGVASFMTLVFKHPLGWYGIMGWCALFAYVFISLVNIGITGYDFDQKDKNKPTVFLYRFIPPSTFIFWQNTFITSTLVWGCLYNIVIEHKLDEVLVFVTLSFFAVTFTYFTYSYIGRTVTPNVRQKERKTNLAFS